jgi:hypothetical protein
MSITFKLRRTGCLLAVAIFVLAACDDSSPKGMVYTLYRNAPGSADARIHVASFDAAQDKDYNRTNCEVARQLFASQSGVTVRYWCERDRFQP